MFYFSFGSKRLFERKKVYKLFKLFNVLEKTWLCQIFKVSFNIINKTLKHHQTFISFMFLFSYFKRYPMCLYFLDLLQYEHFRREITSGQCAKFIEDQQLLHWQHYIRKRIKLLQQASNSFPDSTQFSNQMVSKWIFFIVCNFYKKKHYTYFISSFLNKRAKKWNFCKLCLK